MLRYQEKVHNSETFFLVNYRKKQFFSISMKSSKYPILITLGPTYSPFVHPKGLPNNYGSTRPMNYNFPGSN